MQEDLVYKALADPTRRLMLDELCERKEQTLYELTARLLVRHEVAISRQAIAKHIAVLEKAGLVSSEKRGKFSGACLQRRTNQGCHGSMAHVTLGKERGKRSCRLYSPAFS